MTEPRSYLGTAIMVMVVTALPFGILWSVGMTVWMDIPFGSVLPFGLAAGLCFGVPFGFLMALFFRGETIRVRVTDRDDFRALVNIATAQIGYYPESQFPDLLVYKPSVQAGLLAGRISVQFDGDEAIVVGPKLYVEKLRKKLPFLREPERREEEPAPRGGGSHNIVDRSGTKEE